VDQWRQDHREEHIIVYYLLMIAQCIPWYILSKRKIILLNILKNLEVWLKNKQGRSSKFSAQIKGENTSFVTSSNIARTME